jgi:hypothetical protein
MQVNLKFETEHGGGDFAHNACEVLFELHDVRAPSVLGTDNACGERAVAGDVEDEVVGANEICDVGILLDERFESRDALRFGGCVGAYDGVEGEVHLSAG